MSKEQYKRKAASRAADYVESGMTLGLGTGSTVAHLIDILSQKLLAGALTNLKAVPTSIATAELAVKKGITVTALTADTTIDLAIDGADEVDPQLNLIKGMGKAFLREKIVETRARFLIIMVDSSKLVDRLGTLSPLPVELVPFGAEVQVEWLKSLGCEVELWMGTDGTPVLTDNGNVIALCRFINCEPPGILDAYSLAEQIKNRTGIVEHGLFLDLAQRVIVAGHSGISVLERSCIK